MYHSFSFLHMRKEWMFLRVKNSIEGSFGLIIDVIGSSSFSMQIRNKKNSFLCISYKVCRAHSVLQSRSFRCSLRSATSLFFIYFAKSACQVGRARTIISNTMRKVLLKFLSLQYFSSHSFLQHLSNQIL